MKKEVLKILKKTFPKKKIPKNFEKMKIGDLPQWDSLGNFNLLLALEQKFEIRFTTSEMSEINSVKQILIALNKRNFKK